MPPGRDLPATSPFAADDGSADPVLAAALAALAGGAATPADVVAALVGARLLVPVLAELTATGTGHDGLAVDKEAATGVVALRVPDGRTALPVFTSVAAMARWRADARPVPTPGPRAAAAALQEGWEVLVVDPGGPCPLVVPHPAVRALAVGQPWRPAVRDGQVTAEVQQAVTATVGSLPGVVSVVVEAGRRAEVAVVLGLVPGLGRAALDQVVARAGDRLAADAVVTGTVDTLEIRVTTAR